MTIEVKLMTAEEFFALPDDAAGKRELVYGEVIEMPPPGFGHGEDQLGIGSTLRAFARSRGLGRVVTEVGFILRRDPDLIRLPDVAFVREGRAPVDPERREQQYEGAPDLAIEIVSPGDRAADVRAKVSEYLAHGTPLVWVAHARRRTVTAHRRGRRPRVYRDGDPIDGEDVLPGFAGRVSEFFD